MVCLYICSVLTLVLAGTYWYLKKTFNYWKKQKVPCVPDPIPGFGHVLPVLTLKESVIGFTERIYKQTDASVIGFYFLRTPAIVARDPEIVKCVLQTNFSNFRNNMITLDKETDPVLARNPFFITDPHAWRTSRQRTVTHLSGKKLRILFNFISDVSLKVNQFVERKIKENGSIYECQLKEFFERYTGEFVANAAFGIEGDSFEDNPGPMAFTRVAKTLLEPTLINGIKQSLLFYFPALGKFLNVSFLAKSTDNYFRENLKRIIKERNEKGIAVNDYLQFCLDDQTSDEEFNDVVADIIIFFGDSYETSSVTLTLLFYLLSKNQDVQDKLRKHIFEVMRENGGEINYETVKKMTYLDQVISETMRLMAPAGTLFKVCTEEITLKGPDGVTCHFKPGHVVLIPISSIHTDSKYWTDPTVFNPDRFNPEIDINYHKFAYIPFGEGPRMCVGMRLGQTLVRLAAASLLTKYVIEPSSITKEPLERDSYSFLTYFKGGLWGKFKKLN